MAQVRLNKKRYCRSEHENENSGLAVNSYILHNLVVPSDKYAQYSPNVCSVKLNVAYSVDNSAMSKSFIRGVSHLLP